MNIAFQRTKLRATTMAIKGARVGIQAFSKVLYAAADPLLAYMARVYRSSPMMTLIFFSTAWAWIPLYWYQNVKDYVLPTDRRDKEEARIRLCLQKGIDPFPDMLQKDLVMGRNSPSMQNDSSRPRGVDFETQAVWRQKAAQQHLRNGEQDASLHELKMDQENLKRAAMQARILGYTPELFHLRSQNEVEGDKVASPPILKF